MKCYLTEQEIEVGDIVLRAKNSDFQKHVVTKLTKKGMCVSRELKVNVYTRSTIPYHYIISLNNHNVEEHNSIVYVNEKYKFIIVGKYSGDMDKFKQIDYKKKKEELKILNQR